MKQIPYGIDDFECIINEDYYYIDKTRYIETVEMQASYILFVRPRRMGKSLFVNKLMLAEHEGLSLGSEQWSQLQRLVKAAATATCCWCPRARPAARHATATCSKSST